MGKHNGKARSSGTKVGSALVNKARKDGKGSGVSSANIGRHTTTDGGHFGMQSVLETNDLNEIMNMADLAGRDFSAERGESVVISTGAAVSNFDCERDAEARAVAEERNRHRLRVPRRPKWTREMTAEQLDAQERAAFLAWRRDLAKLEEDERLVLTPFEKNLEVWRQLWRVLERSDIIVQVIDARDPLTYRSSDLEDYAKDISPHKASLLLLNKSDLLPEAARVAWADYFDSRGIAYIFWSAKLAAAASDDDTGEAAQQLQACKDPRVRLLTCDQLVERFAQKAQEAVDARGGVPDEQASTSQQHRLVVGLTGYPNVGKSSTINALFGSKKTAVAATPGKTKHFQTLIITDELLLCDCPGLVLPKYAHSKAEMVAAGVIPIDRLTDVRAPIEVVLRQAGVQQIQHVYNITIPASKRAPTATDALAAFARARGWTTGAGLPDEARAGRQMLKDFCDGKLVSFCMPPGQQPTAVAGAVPSAAAPARLIPTAALPEDSAARPGDAAETAQQPLSVRATNGSAAAAEAAPADSGGAAVQQSADGNGRDASQHAAAMPPVVEDISEADLALMQELNLLPPGARGKPTRAAHKFHGKGSRRRAMSIATG